MARYEYQVGILEPWPQALCCGGPSDEDRYIDTAHPNLGSLLPKQGCYRGVFPVKCNHDRELITTILESGANFGWGLEVGSKPELLMAMTLLGQAPGSLLICNGYKDQEYIELVSILPSTFLHCSPHEYQLLAARLQS